MAASLYLVVAAFCSTAVLAEIVYYDSFTNAVLSKEKVNELVAAGTDYYCANAIETCSLTEGRRLDGSCSNLAHPYAGAATYAFKNLVPTTSTPKRGRLPLAREVRTALLQSGWRSAPVITQLGMLFLQVVMSDFTPQTVRDCNNYLVRNTCCKDDSNPICVRMDVPEWDYLNILAGVKCLNLTRPMDYEMVGCLPPNQEPRHRLNHGSASIDIKWMYGVDWQSSVRMRLFHGGLLNYTIGTDGKERPELTPHPANPEDGMAGTGAYNYYFALIFWNEHNRIARELAKLNPHWTDQQLFEKTRDINIAQYTQIYFYEALPIVYNYENMLQEGLISSNPGFRDVYDPSVLPGFWTESLYVHRWFHTIQRVDVERYTEDGVRYDNFPDSLTDLPAHFNVGKNLSYFSQGVFRTNSGKSDNLMDGFMAETLYVPWHVAGDLGTTDIQKGRLLYIAPYVDIVKECEGVYHHSYDTLGSHLDEDTIDILKNLYATDEPAAVELMAGLWREKHHPGSRIPKTVYCLIMKQLRRIIHSDRHWYERPNRPHAFNAAQLAQIRKASFARLMCDNMPGIEHSGITKKSFQPLSNVNPIVSCEEIPHVDLSAWKDSQTRQKRDNSKQCQHEKK